jgi:toxin ParE1/3/4
VDVRYRRQAREDLEQATDWYAAEGGFELVDRFVRDLERTIAVIAQMPHAGIRDLEVRTGIQGLRARRCRVFPYLVMWIVGSDHVDVVRVLHEHRDLERPLVTTDVWSDPSAEQLLADTRAAIAEDPR